MVRALFLCSRARLRSVTAARVFAEWEGVETDYAGLLRDADVPLEPGQIEWADIVFVMEKIHKRRLDASFRPYLRGKRVVVLGIRDQYQLMQPALVQLLEQRVGPLLRA